MSTPQGKPVNIIVATNKNNGIGYQNALPWHIPQDLAWFKQATQNTTLIMGTATFNSLPKTLPGRHHIILSRTKHPNTQPNITHATSLSAAINIADQLSDQTISIVGGQQVYTLALNHPTLVDTQYISRINITTPADTFYPGPGPGFHLTKTTDKDQFKIETYKRITV